VNDFILCSEFKKVLTKSSNHVQNANL